MKNFLITAANSDISIGISRILRLTFPDARIIGVAPDGNLPGSHFFDKVYPIPLVQDFLCYQKKMNNILVENGIDVLCPISEQELMVYYQEKYKPIAKTVINPPEVLENFLDKFKTFQWLIKHEVNVPETILLSEEPDKLLNKCVIKPRSSAGSKNMYYVSDKFLFDALRKSMANNLEKYIVQRCVGSISDEYTCAVWRFKSTYREVVLKRKLVGGLTGEAEVVVNSDISSLLNKIAQNIKGDFFINVQLRLENGVPYVFEINPRFSSTVMLRHKVGFQDVFWTFLANLNMSQASYQAPQPGTKLFRISDELIIN